jgi:hypothetical protein
VGRRTSDRPSRCRSSTGIRFLLGVSSPLGRCRESILGCFRRLVIYGRCAVQMRTRSLHLFLHC